MKRAFIAIALLLAGLIIGAYVTANTIMVNAEITGTAGNASNGESPEAHKDTIRTQPSREQSRLLLACEAIAGDIPLAWV